MGAQPVEQCQGAHLAGERAGAGRADCQEPEDRRGLLGQRFRAFYGRAAGAVVDSRRPQARDAALQGDRQPLRLEGELRRWLGSRTRQRHVPGLGHSHRSFGRLEDGDLQCARRLETARAHQWHFHAQLGNPARQEYSPNSGRRHRGRNGHSERRSAERCLANLEAGTQSRRAGQGDEGVSADAAGGSRNVERAGVERLHAHRPGSSHSPPELEARPAHRQTGRPASRRFGPGDRPLRAPGGGR